MSCSVRLQRPFVQVPRIVTALCAEKFALLSSFCLHFMPRRGLSLEVRVSPYNTVCVGGDLLAEYVQPIWFRVGMPGLGGHWQ